MSANNPFSTINIGGSTRNTRGGYGTLPDILTQTFPTYNPTFPTSQNLPTSQSPNINTLPNGQVQVTSGQTTLDKFIQASLQTLALLTRQGYVPTEQQPQQQPFFYPATNIDNGLSSNVGGTLGATAQDFIQRNFTAIAIGVGVYLLYSSGRKK